MDKDQIQMEDDLLILNDVARAVEENEFVPYVQPVCNLSTNKVVGCEALVRWTLPDDGTVVPAGLFVPSLERTNTICGLDWFMIEEMCKYVARVANTPAQVPASLNISAQHCKDKSFASRLAAAADWPGIPHELIRVELSEKTLLKGGECVQNLVATVAEQGFNVIADNCVFDGNLESLKKMGVSLVKISSSYWRGAKDLKADVQTVESLGLTIAAEGVETAEERDALAAAGIAYAQGYHFAHPMSLEEFTKFCS